MVPLQNWWNELEIERSEENIHYSENINSDILIPADLFNTVVNNLIENALRKALDHEDITVQVAIECTGNRAVLTVSDNGRAIPAEIVVNLFKQPLTSASGLGVGLLQAHKLADDCGYCLELAENRDGRVRFRLYRR
ncbi:MAG: sensor histidine kinase [Gammaproteobacteria bacterium]|nr:sensor histidine kinase [Gammaproteobacteria bacterium]